MILPTDHLDVVRTRRPQSWPRVWINHGPGLVLKENASWRTWNGIGFRIGEWLTFVHVRTEERSS